MAAVLDHPPIPVVPWYRHPANTSIEAMHSADPHCRWCGTRTVLARQASGTLPRNAATRDHLFSRVHPLWNVLWRNAVVLSCRECNQQRGTDEPILLASNPIKSHRAETLRLIALGGGKD